MDTRQNEHRIGRVRLIASLVFLGILEGCGRGLGPSPDVSFQLAAKANVFINVAALLFAQGPAYWGQGLRSLYYSALTLARLKEVNAFIDSTERFHVKVWGLSPLPIREYFGKDMKKVRTRYDYDIVANQDDAASDLASFFEKGVTPFELLLVQACKNVEDDYHHCTETAATCKYCSGAKVDSCLKQAAEAKLEATRSTLREIVARNSKLTMIDVNNETKEKTIGI